MSTYKQKIYLTKIDKSCKLIYLNIKLLNKPRRGLCFLMFLVYSNFMSFFFFDKLKMNSSYFLNFKIYFYCYKRFFYKFITLNNSIT